MEKKFLLSIYIILCYLFEFMISQSGEKTNDRKTYTDIINKDYVIYFKFSFYKNKKFF